MSIKKSQISAIIFAAIAIVIIIIGTIVFRKQYEQDPVVPGPGVTRITKLSEWYPNLKGTVNDTDVYILDSGVPGGKFLIWGGTHTDEVAGVMAAYILVENMVPTVGCFYIIPHANESAFTNTEPGKGAPDRVYFTLDDGSTRWFRMGSRATNPLHQWPDPEMYVHYPSGQFLAPDEARNFNRVHPGKANGTITQQTAYAFNQLVTKEGIDMVLDMHEAPPEKPLVDAVCAHQDALELVTELALNLEFDDVFMRIEQSPVNLHGFSHREMGDHTDALAILSEEVNLIQGAVHGAINAQSVLDGQDKFYDILKKRAIDGENVLQTHWNYETEVARHIETDEPIIITGEPIAYRSARNLTMIYEMIYTFNDLYPEKPMEAEGIPLMAEIMSYEWDGMKEGKYGMGLAHYLHSGAKAPAEWKDLWN